MSGVTSSTKCVTIASIGEDLPGISVEPEGTHYLELDPINISAQEFRQLFYQDGENFELNRCNNLSERLRKKLQLSSLTYDNGTKKLNLSGFVLKNAEEDLDVPQECWEDCSVINLEKVLQRLKNFTDVGGDCGKTCSLGYEEFVDVLKSLDVAIVDFDANCISETSTTDVQAYDKTSNMGALQAQAFKTREPFWATGKSVSYEESDSSSDPSGCAVAPLVYPGVGPWVDASANVSSAESRRTYSKCFSYQQTIVGVVFKIPNPDAKDTIVKVSFNVNWGSNNKRGSTAVNYQDGSVAHVPNLPLVSGQVVKSVTDISGGTAIWTDLKNKPVLVTVESTDGFFIGDAVTFTDKNGAIKGGVPTSDAEKGKIPQISRIVSPCVVELKASISGTFTGTGVVGSTMNILSAFQ